MSDEFDNNNYYTKNNNNIINNNNIMSNTNNNNNNVRFMHSQMHFLDNSDESKIYDKLVSTSDSSNSIYTQYMNISSVTDRNKYTRPMLKFFATNLASKLSRFYAQVKKEASDIMYKVAQMHDDYDTYTEQRDGLTYKLAQIKMDISDLNFQIRENELYSSNVANYSGGGGGGSSGGGGGRDIDLKINNEIAQLKKRLFDKTQELNVYQTKYNQMEELIFDYDDQTMNIVDEMTDNRKVFLTIIRICNKYLDNSVEGEYQFLPGIENEFSIELPVHFTVKELVFLNMCLEETENVASAHLKWHTDIYSLLNAVSTKNITNKLQAARFHMSESTVFLVTSILIYIRMHFLHLN